MNLNASDAKAVDLILNGLGGTDEAERASKAMHATSNGGNGGARRTNGHGNNPTTRDGPFQPYAATHGTAPAMSDDLANRIDHAEGLLRLLDAWPAPDPPDGLVERTIGRIHESGEGRQPRHQHQPGSGHAFGYGASSAASDASARHTMRKHDPS